MKRGRFLALLLCVGCILTGCSGFSPAVTGVSVDKKGGITEVVRESFDASYYSEEELESEIGKEIEAYNSQKGDKSVKKKSLKVKDGIAELKMSYVSAGDYAQFNQVDFYLGDVIGAVQAGYVFEGVFHTVTSGSVDESSAVFGSKLISGTNYKAVVFKGPLLTEVPGTILYVSENVKVTNKTTGVVEEEGTAYILYE